MKEGNRISTEDVTLPDGRVLTEADFERMALEAETATYDIDELRRTAKRRMGRPPLGDGPSSVLQVRLDEQTRHQLTERAEREHRTASEVVREAIQAWLTAS